MPRRPTRTKRNSRTLPCRRQPNGDADGMRDRSQSSPTGSEIFAKAVQTWSALPTPTYLSYAVVVTIERHGRAHVDRQRVVFRTVDRVGIAQDASGAVTFGRPRYVPDVAFRLVPTRRTRLRRRAGRREALRDRARRNRTPPRPRRLSSAPHAALRSEAQQRARDVGRYANLHDVAADRRSAMHRRPARGTFRLTATYAPVGDAWLLRTVDTSGALRFGFFAYGGKATVTFDDLRRTEKPPAAFRFDRSGYTQHREQCETSFDHCARRRRPAKRPGRRVALHRRRPLACASRSTRTAAR